MREEDENFIRVKKYNLVFAQYGESIFGLWTERFSKTSIIQLLGLFEREKLRDYIC